jgi:PilZ domain
MPPVRASHATAKEIPGRIQNVSQGGLCFLSTQPLAVSAFVVCAIAMADIPVSIPALMQVRWTVKRGKEAHHYIHGLRFVAN